VQASWRTGTKGKLKARFAAVRVRVADGPPQRIRDKGQQHLPRDEAWLIGEHRMSGEKKYYLANLPAKTDLRTLATTIKARWICEQARRSASRGRLRPTGTTHNWAFRAAVSSGATALRRLRQSEPPRRGPHRRACQRRGHRAQELTSPAFMARSGAKARGTLRSDARGIIVPRSLG
jgi:hypothetical protein